MREEYYTPEEEEIIKTIRPDNTSEELKLLLSIKSDSVQNALWRKHCLNKDFIDLWVDSINEENAHNEQSAIKHIIFYPNYSSTSTKVRMQCIDVVHDISRTLEYKTFIELKVNERVVPHDRFGNRETSHRIHFDVYEKEYGPFPPPYNPCAMYCYGGSIPPFRKYILKKEEYKQLWNIHHMGIVEVDVFYKEDTHYFSSYARWIATKYLESKEALESLLDDNDIIVRQIARGKLYGENLEFLQKRVIERKEEIERRIATQQGRKRLVGSVLFFDTETTGTPRSNIAPVTDSYNWPRLVQLAWIMTDKDGKVLKRQSHIIIPENFYISDDAVKVHHITTERALQEGQLLHVVLDEFLSDLELAEQVVGHNIDFDMHIVGAELYRMNLDYNLLMNKPSTCTMKLSTNYCAIPKKNSDAYKWPSLPELYRKLFNRDFADAHDALADITATKECFFELRKRGII